jgi:aminoglycoside phosphotransferase (APT) family kinase protein
MTRGRPYGPSWLVGEFRPRSEVMSVVYPDNAPPSTPALEEIRRLAGPSAQISAIRRLEGGQHSLTWRVDTRDPETSVVVRQFPAGDRAAESERQVLQSLEGLGGLAPVLLGGDLAGLWSQGQTSLLSLLDGSVDITPQDPRGWAEALGGALAIVHGVPAERTRQLPSVFDGRGSDSLLEGPLASRVLASWRRVTTAPEVLVHGDFWSGNVVARNGVVTGVVDWSGAVRGPRGYDVAWCRLDLVLLFEQTIADAFLVAYEAAAGVNVRNVWSWDSWAAARSHSNVETWEPNYAPLGRADLTPSVLKDRHNLWTKTLLAHTAGTTERHPPTNSRACG